LPGRVLLRLLCFIFLVQLCTSTVCAQSATRLVKVGIFDGPGYAVQDKDGNWSGIDIEMIENIAQTAGFRLEFCDMPSAYEGLHRLKTGSLDMLADMAKTPERERNFIFSEYEQGNSGTSLFVRQDDDRWDYGSSDQIKSMKISCEHGNIAAIDLRSWCHQYGFSPDIREYNTADEAMDAVRRGERDGFVEGEDYREGFRTILSFSPSPYYFAFARDNTELKAKVDAAMAQILLQNPLYEKELLQKYVGLTSSRDATFTREEKAYISLAVPVRVAVVKNDRPYFYGSSTEPRGILPEYYARIAAVTGLHFVFISYPDQRSAIRAIANGGADLIGVFSGGPIEAYNVGLSITRSYASVGTVMISRSGTDFASEDAARQKLLRIAVKVRSMGPIVQSLPDYMSASGISACETAEDCFNSLKSNKVDAVFIDLPSATYLINQTNPSAYTIAPISSINLELCAVAGRGSQMLISIMNKGINASSYAVNGIIARSTVTQDSLETSIARISPTIIAVFGAAMILLVIFLVSAVIMLAKSRRTKLAALSLKSRAEEQRIRAEESEKSAEEKTAFFSNISHDMRTPLNAVLGFAAEARKPDISPALRNEYLSKVELSGRLLLDLINDTLTVSKMSSGKLILNLEPCRISELVESVASTIRGAARNKNIELIVDSPRVPGRTIMADRLKLEKIFLNLLSNAVKYTPSGGHIWYTIAEEPADPDQAPKPSAPAAAVPAAGGAGAQPSPRQFDYTVTVRDDGIGMAASYLPHIFEPFSQEMRPGYESVGTGLGLSIVKQLVALMGGTIEVQSVPNRGTAFTVRLRFAEAGPSALEQAGAALPGADLKGRRVLLCEDNELNAEIASVILKGKGLVVSIAGDGAEGLRMFSQSAPGAFDCVLMDMRMPIMDGLEATRAIRALKRPDAKTIPIIAMTANAFAEDVQLCLESGMNGYISKPISADQVCREIQSRLEAAV